MPPFTVAPPTEAALPACFALLPDLAAPEAMLFAARDGDGVLAGAGGLLWQSWGDPPGTPVWIHVLPDRRRQGIGRALLAAVREATAGEIDALWAIRPLDQDGEAAAFARACGFHAVRRQMFFAAETRAYLHKIEHVVARIAARGRLPRSAEIRPLDAAPADEIARLVAEGMATAPPRIAAMLAAAASGDPATAPIDRERSCLLMADGALAGALLSRRLPAEDASHVVCNVVAPGWRRGGWANALLILGFTRRLIEAGCAHIGFDCAEDNRDTMGLGERSGAALVRVDGLYRYAASAARSR